MYCEDIMWVLNVFKTWLAGGWALQPTSAENYIFLGYVGIMFDKVAGKRADEPFQEVAAKRK